jgi:hypothetical protein
MKTGCASQAYNIINPEQTVNKLTPTPQKSTLESTTLRTIAKSAQHRSISSAKQAIN